MTKKKSTKSGGARKAKTSGSAKGMDPISTSASAGSEISSPSTATAANTTNTDGPSQASNLIVQDNTESGLLKLPNEIKQRIWTLAVTVDEPITPFQLRSKSNKFIWSLDQINKETRAKDVSAVPQLTAVQLSKVSRQVYQEVAASGLFYKVNDFRFIKESEHQIPTDPLTYLVAITEPRRKAIRSLGFEWGHWGKGHGAQVFTVLAACQGLQSLQLELSWRLGEFFKIPTSQRAAPNPLPGFKEFAIAIQGLKKLAVSVGDLPSNYGGWGASYHDETKKLRNELESVSEEYMVKPRSITYSLEKFRQAQIEANLDVHGEGRLSEDKKPGLISSRTRQSTRNVEKLAADGTLPDRDSPKYDLNGDLAWTVSTIEKCREVSVDEVPSVEFFIKGGPSISARYWRVQEGKEQEFWEDISTLNSMNCRHKIVDFYENNPRACGMQIVLDIWKLRSFEAGPEDKIKRQTEKRLEAMIRYQTLIEKVEAEQAARAARQATKDSAKTSKKVKKVKPAVGRR